MDPRVEGLERYGLTARELAKAAGRGETETLAALVTLVLLGKAVEVWVSGEARYVPAPCDVFFDIHVDRAAYYQAKRRGER